MSQNNGEEDNVVIESDSSAAEDAIDISTQKQYRIWKKNAPFLYDFLSTNSLLWPSLSLQFFPDVVSVASDDGPVSLQRLLLGSFTLGQAIDAISIYQTASFSNLNANIKLNKLDYNQDKQEFELQTSTSTKLKLLQRINHYGDVNKLRFMPQKPNVLASANNHGDLVIYERTKLPSVARSNDTELPKPQLYLRSKSLANDSEIFALDWNLQAEAVLASGDIKGEINIYDINKYSSNESVLNESHYVHNSHGINDLEWVPNHDSLFTIVDEGGNFKLYDTRANKFVTEAKISLCGVNSVSLNPGHSTCFATGDSSGIIEVWDIRNVEQGNSFYQIKNRHTDSITQLKWHRKFHNVLASSSTDTLVRIFDISTSKDDDAIFIHKGHMLGVNDFDWSYHDDWLIASVADDNSLQVWRPANEITQGYK